MKTQRIEFVGLVLSLAFACTSCSVVYRAYTPPNLARAQVAQMESYPKVIEVDGQTKSPRGDEYAKMQRTSARGPLRLQLPPGAHTFLLEAGKEGWLGPGTRVVGMHPDFYYTGTPVRFALSATLEAGRNYEVDLRLTRRLTAGEGFRVGAVSALGSSSTIKGMQIRDVVVVILFCIQCNINDPVKAGEGLDLGRGGFQLTEAVCQGAFHRV
ncbi:MAG: hypothetical protein ABSA45_09125, partial [Verrucomicrobiota bacterium]